MTGSPTEWLVVGGDAGIGKSRLVAALAERARSTGNPVLSGRTTEQDGAPPYWPWTQVLEPLGARTLLEGPAGSDPESERFSRFDAVASCRFRRAPRSSSSRTSTGPILRRSGCWSIVAGRISSAPVLLVVTYRQSPLDQVADFEGVLDDLIRVPGGAPTGAAVASTPVEVGAGSWAPRTTPEAAQQVWAASDGNPLYVGELARHLAAGGDLRHRAPLHPGRHPGAPGPTFERLCRGRPGGRRHRPDVQRRPGRDGDRAAALPTLQDLDEAVAAGLIGPTGTPGEFRFVHALVRDAVEATLGAAELPALHRPVAEAIASYDGDRRRPARRRPGPPLGCRARPSATGRPPHAGASGRRSSPIDGSAWEQAAHLFERSLELGGSAADAIDQLPALGRLGPGPAALRRDRGDDLALRPGGRRRSAGSAAPTSLAEALLILEGRALPSRELRLRSIEALDGCRPTTTLGGPGCTAISPSSAYYLDSESMIEHCDQAEAEAAESTTRSPTSQRSTPATRSCYGAEHAAARLELAERLGRVARARCRPSVALWEPLHPARRARPQVRPPPPRPQDSPRLGTRAGHRKEAHGPSRRCPPPPPPTNQQRMSRPSLTGECR